jgi:hypothetical protein
MSASRERIGQSLHLTLADLPQKISTGDKLMNLAVERENIKLAARIFAKRRNI